MKLNATQAAEALRSGGVVVIPTETVYGLAANALEDQAVLRIYEHKRRPRFNPLIVHVLDLAEAARYASAIPEPARLLAQAFWPGPLTLVLPKNDAISDLVTSGLPHVALRSPSHPVAREILAQAGVPLAAPSANTFGHLSATRLDDVEPALLAAVDGYVDGGPCAVGVESTIVGFFDNRVELLRPGGITREAIETLIGPLSVLRHEKPLAPGMIAKHYAPTTPFVYGWKVGDALPAGRVGLLCMGDATFSDFVAIERLSLTGDLREAATNLFSALKRLENQGLDHIVATPFPETGLGEAIGDRLKRASYQWVDEERSRSGRKSGDTFDFSGARSPGRSATSG